MFNVFEHNSAQMACPDLVRPLFMVNSHGDSDFDSPEAKTIKIWLLHKRSILYFQCNIFADASIAECNSELLYGFRREAINYIKDRISIYLYIYTSLYNGKPNTGENIQKYWKSITKQWKDKNKMVIEPSIKIYLSQAPEDYTPAQ